MNATPQKLSKIETLRLATNYIDVLGNTLKENKPMDSERYIKLLSKNLSQTTANLIANSVLKESATEYWEEKSKMYYTNDLTPYNKMNTQWISNYNTCGDHCWSSYKFPFWYSPEEGGSNIKYWNKDLDIIGENLFYTRFNC